MGKVTEYISSQLKNPKGFGGRTISFVQNVANQKMYRELVRLVHMYPSDKLLDIGYGNGYLIKRLYGKCPNKMYGIDVSDDAMAMATKHNAKANAAKKLHLSVGDCCDLPYEDNMFAAVTSINTIYFWKDTLKGLTEIRRVLKEGQSFYNVIYTKEYLEKIKYAQTGFKKFTPKELEALGKEAGFSSVKGKYIVKDKSLIVVFTK